MDERHTEQPAEKRVVWGSLAVFVAVLFVWGVLFAAPSSFPTDASDVFTVNRGASLESISTELAAHGFLRSPLLFRVIVHLRGDQRNLVAGDYSFNKPLDVFELAGHIARGEFNLLPVKITIPEGLNKFEIAAILQKHIARFDTIEFIERAPEGYLFPDTYFFPRNATPQHVIATMRENFYTKVATIKDKIDASGRSLPDIVSVASIVELEARQTSTRKIVAGILWKRLDMKMPLQVDVSFRYINGKTTQDLTTEDLAIDSPYNSYKYKGLPPTPLGNPGLAALGATLEPTKTPYLFFLSDHDGTMHYAKTFDEHKKNREMYL